jgi:hypothetical protein
MTRAPYKEIIDYLSSKSLGQRVPAKELCAMFGISSERKLRDYIKHIRLTICWVNSSTTKGKSGYWIGVRDSRQLEAHAASEFKPVLVQKKREKFNVPQQGALFQ